jgi:2-(1,2-epoxy-1,2-dihydrophenyl)acetyl-CoA isomerase
VRVVVITGTGRAFCAGDDMSGRARDWDGATALVPDLPRGHRDPIGTYEGLRTMSQGLNLAVRALDKITIAAINGLAIQTGLSLALACDFRIASSTARLGSATLRFGLLPDEGGHALTVQLIGLAKAIDFFLRKRIVTAGEALQLGLVHEVVEPEQLMERAIALAEELAAGPQAAMRMLKRSLYNAADTTLQQAFDDIAIRTAVTDHHPDAREGVTAFREKREARFS